MMRATQKKRPRARVARTDRRWCIPPAILREPDETLEGSHVLNEVPGDLGLLLWSALRDVTLWAGVPQERRRGLFRTAAARRRLALLADCRPEPEMEVSLATLAAVPANPEGVRAEAVTLACMRISVWAEARRAYGTALVYAQAGALASPERAASAYAVGRVALAWGRLPRAESWLRRTVGVARRSGDWESYGWAYVDLGVLLARRGALDTARRHLVKGLRAARRHGLLPVRAGALHGLFRVAVAAGDSGEAERLARAAAGAYGREHPRMGEMLYDLAEYSLARGRAGRAAAMLQRLLAGRTDEAGRVAALALLARAAAGTGDTRLYEEAWSAAWTLATAAPPAEHAAAMLGLARASEEREDWLRVDQAARLAAEGAARPEERRLAEGLMAAAAQARLRRA